MRYNLYLYKSVFKTTTKNDLITILKKMKMKKLAFLTLTLLFSVSLVFGQTEKKDERKIKETRKELKADRVALRKLEGTEVSASSKENFSADFHNVSNVKWKRNGPFDEASFTQDGKNFKAFYDFDSKLVGTTHFVTFADVPANGQKEIKKEYKDYSIGSVVFFKDNEINDSDMFLYGVQFDDEDNYFVEMTKGTKKIILQVISSGEIFLFKEL